VSEPPQIAQIELEARWTGVDDVPIVLANQLVAQFVEGNAILTFGQVAPPALAGTPEQQAEQAAQIQAVPIRTLARFAVPPHRLPEFSEALRKTVAALEEIARVAEISKAEKASE